MSAYFLCSREHAVLPVVVNLVLVAAEGLMLHTQITLVFGTEETGPPCPPPLSWAVLRVEVEVFCGLSFMCMLYMVFVKDPRGNRFHLCLMAMGPLITYSSTL